MTDEVDIEFYRYFYEDMRDKDDEFIISHALSLGKAEKRLISFGQLIAVFSIRGITLPSDFDGEAYLALNKDVAENVCRPWQAAVHYLFSGFSEERLYRYPDEYAQSQGSQRPPDQSLIDAGDRWGDYEHLTFEQRSSLVEGFDEHFYLTNSPDLSGASIDLFYHFLYFGWREHRDPSPEFSTSYYLSTNSDIANSGMNPYVHYILHGRKEGRACLSYEKRIARKEYSPLVTVVVPNYNHSRYIERRLDSIFGQTYKNIEVIILDDASIDDSLAVIEEYLCRTGCPATLLKSNQNSGSPFKQWRRGVAEANGDLIWICESDDTCEPSFLAECVECLRDDSVMLAFGRILYIDQEDNIISGLDSYRESAEPGIWHARQKRPAAEWFKGAFGACNIIPNVGGCVFKNQNINERIWEEAGTYKVVGDWYLYLIISNGGQIVYEPKAIAFFRQHVKNTSVKGLRTSVYYQEHERIAKALRSRWETPPNVIIQALSRLYQTFEHSKARSVVGHLRDLYSTDRILATDRVSPHILICIKGFHLGGGEIFPIHLANHMLNRGNVVSLLVLDTNGEIVALREKLDRRIAIYEAQYLKEKGINNFILTMGVDLIHTHYVGLEFFFFDDPSFMKITTPYVITLHGSYETTHIPDRLHIALLKRVSHWIYLTSDNIEHLRGIPLDRRRIRFIANGLPLPTQNSDITRASMNITDDAVVFTIASRAIEDKGWHLAIEAFRCLVKTSPYDLVLLLIGDGPMLEFWRNKYSSEERLRFLGFKVDVDPYLALSDALVLPTRFKGESFPLIIIQAFQAGLPVIATGVGQIPQMLQIDGEKAGILIEYSVEDSDMIADIRRSMNTLVDRDFRRDMTAVAARFGSAYDIEKAGAEYEAVYLEARSAELDA